MASVLRLLGARHQLFPFVGLHEVLQHQPGDRTPDVVGEPADPVDLLLRRDKVLAGESGWGHFEDALT